MYAFSSSLLTRQTWSMQTMTASSLSPDLILGQQLSCRSQAEGCKLLSSHICAGETVYHSHLGQEGLLHTWICCPHTGSIPCSNLLVFLLNSASHSQSLLLYVRRICSEDVSVLLGMGETLSSLDFSSSDSELVEQTSAHRSLDSREQLDTSQSQPPNRDLARRVTSRTSTRSFPSWHAAVLIVIAMCLLWCMLQNLVANFLC